MTKAPNRFRFAWLELMILSLIWGLASVGLWAAAWSLFGEPFGRVMPALAVASVGLLWPFRKALAAAVEILFGPDAARKSIAISLWVLLLTAGLAGLRQDWRYDSYLMPMLSWIRPWEKIYRVLILMPLWGAWAMLVTLQFNRLRPASGPAVAALAAGCGPVTTSAVMGLLLAVTVSYFGFLPWEQLSISATTIIAAVLAGVICCRKSGGLSLRALLAANLLTQLVFLLAYLAAQRLLLW